MKRTIGKAAAAMAAAFIIATAAAAPALAYSSNKFFDGPIPPNSIASESSWRTEVGGDMNVVLATGGGLTYGTSYIANDTAAGAHYQAQSNGYGASLSHSATPNTWSSCWWLEINSGNGGNAALAQCYSRSQ